MSEVAVVAQKQWRKDHELKTWDI